MHRCPSALRKAALPSTIVLPSTMALGALAGRRIEIRDLRQGELPLFRRGDDGMRRGMFGGALDAGRQAQQLGLIEAVARSRCA